MKVLGFGGRDFGMTVDTEGRHPVLRVRPEEIRALFEALDNLHQDNPNLLPAIDTLIAGCAPGADFLCAVWACSRGIPVKEFPADWKTFSSAAGPKRNVQMAKENPDLGVRFGGNAGSDHMQTLLEGRNIPVDVNE